MDFWYPPGCWALEPESEILNFVKYILDYTIPYHTIPYHTILYSTSYYTIRIAMFMRSFGPPVGGHTGLPTVRRSAYGGCHVGSRPPRKTQPQGLGCYSGTEIHVAIISKPYKFQIQILSFLTVAQMGFRTVCLLGSISVYGSTPAKKMQQGSLGAASSM